MREFQMRMRGVIGSPLTAFRDDLSVDYDCVARASDRLAGYPFCALLASSGIGELYSLSVDEAAELTRVTVDAVAGRMPVIAGTGFNAVIGADLARQAERAGAAALLVLPPYYTNAGEAGMLEYFRAIGNASGLPLVIYSRDWASFSPDAVARIVAQVPTVAAWKDGQGDMRRLQRIMSRVGDRLVWMGGLGDDAAPAYFGVGVKVFSSSLSALAPALSLRIAQAGLEGDFAAMRDLLNRFVHPLFAVRERKKGYDVAVMKHAAELLGIPAGRARPPLPELDEESAAEVRRAVDLLRPWSDVRESGALMNAPS